MSHFVMLMRLRWGRGGEDFDEETILTSKHFSLKAPLQFQFLIFLFIGNFVALHCTEGGIALQETCLKSKLRPKSFIKNLLLLLLLLLHNGTNSYFKETAKAGNEVFIETTRLLPINEHSFYGDIATEEGSEQPFLGNSNETYLKT